MDHDQKLEDQLDGVYPLRLQRAEERLMRVSHLLSECRPPYKEFYLTDCINLDTGRIKEGYVGEIRKRVAKCVLVETLSGDLLAHTPKQRTSQQPGQEQRRFYNLSGLTGELE